MEKRAIVFPLKTNFQTVFSAISSTEKDPIKASSRDDPIKARAMGIFNKNVDI